jgi:hypothetical protein
MESFWSSMQIELLNRKRKEDQDRVSKRHHLNTSRSSTTGKDDIPLWHIARQSNLSWTMKVHPSQPEIHTQRVTKP